MEEKKKKERKGPKNRTGRRMKKKKPRHRNFTGEIVSAKVRLWNRSKKDIMMERWR